MTRTGWARLCAAGLVGAGIGVASMMIPFRGASPLAALPASPALTRAANGVADALSPASAEAHYPAVDLADVAEQATAAVVNISSTQIIKAPEGGEDIPLPEDPLFRRFFGAPPGMSHPKSERAQSLGSGVIVSSDGYILTNNHVVDHADTIHVTLADRREFDAKVVGTDPRSDIALLHLKGDVKNLHVLPFGDSDKLRLADTVLAIGDPFGIGETVTMGIVSAVGRANVGIADYEDFIQTDAAINPGNSGGALVNVHGELVGINTAIVSRSGGNQGIGFAIPSNMARQIMTSLRETGKVQRGWLGVAIQPVDRDLAEALGIEQGHGVLVADVTAKSPAASAGIERGDVIMAIDGKPMESTGQLRNTVASTRIGTKIKIDVIRDKKPQSLTVTVGELPKEKEEQAETEEGGKTEGLLAGVTVSNLTAEVRQQLEIPKTVEKGAVVTDIDRDSAAARAGVMPGDVIIEINRKPVRNAADFRTLAGKAEKSALLLVVRQGGTAFILVKP